jgi:hypothetical protein
VFQLNIESNSSNLRQLEKSRSTRSTGAKAEELAVQKLTKKKQTIFTPDYDMMLFLFFFLKITLVCVRVITV